MSFAIRILGTFLVALLFALSAFARPVTIFEVQEQFAKRGASGVQMALLSGHPVVSGEMEGQSFYAVLGNCDDEDRCSSLNMKSCRRLEPMSRLEVLELANEFNAKRYKGVAIAEAGEIAPSICVEQRFEFPNTLEFGLREVFEWGETLEDFAAYFRQVETSRLAKRVLGGASE